MGCDLPVTASVRTRSRPISVSRAGPNDRRLVMTSVDAPAVTNLLHEFARRPSLRGGNPYRARAYARAAESLGVLTIPLDRLIREDR